MAHPPSVKLFAYCAIKGIENWRKIVDFFCFVFILNSEKQAMKLFIIRNSYSCEVSSTRNNLLQILRTQRIIFYVKCVHTLSSDEMDTPHCLLNFMNETTIMLLTGAAEYSKLCLTWTFGET